MIMSAYAVKNSDDMTLILRKEKKLLIRQHQKTINFRVNISQLFFFPRGIRKKMLRSQIFRYGLPEDFMSEGQKG